MLTQLLKDDNFKQICASGAQNVVKYLLQEGIEFCVLCKIDRVEFNPKLPSHLQKNLKSLTLFLLSGYTLESAQAGDKTLHFEAGFGKENFASFVEVDFGDIIQVAVDDTVVFINLSASLAVQKPKPKDNVQRSVNAFFSNPENSKLL